MRRFRVISFAAWGCAALASMVAAPAEAAWLLSQLGRGSFGLTSITDGTSNTILVGEGSRADLCFNGATAPVGIADGTSNTIQFGETAGLNVLVGDFVPGGDGSFCLNDTEIRDAFVPDITDGTSNTITFGEQTTLDVCFRDVQRGITDGTSNTIILPEITPQACYDDVSPTRDLVAAVPQPGSLALLLTALAVSGVARRRSAA